MTTIGRVTRRHRFGSSQGSRVILQLWSRGHQERERVVQGGYLFFFLGLRLIPIKILMRGYYFFGVGTGVGTGFLTLIISKLEESLDFTGVDDVAVSSELVSDSLNFVLGDLDEVEV